MFFNTYRHTLRRLAPALLPLLLAINVILVSRDAAWVVHSWVIPAQLLLLGTFSLALTAIEYFKVSARRR